MIKQPSLEPIGDSVPCGAPVFQSDPTLPVRDLLTVEQTAQYLQLSPSSIRSYIRQGKLKAFRVAGLRKVLIARAQMLLLLEPTIPSNGERPAVAAP